ncbi:hypothetical protein PsorP6_005960 [Peronosclerospora sorghi]|uniref:Uncharacterized protein n=1 Tax=Peronosclerospora sorghi TaxID=230839 RepID=A0ACC0W448_9STRA|nr:hypothetical protein PsorP6_005960 [Peronosclerospora sorghi]
MMLLTTKGKTISGPTVLQPARQNNTPVIRGEIYALVRPLVRYLLHLQVLVLGSNQLNTQIKTKISVNGQHLSTQSK